MPLLILPGSHAQQRGGGAVEVGEHTVTIEIQLHSQNLAGCSLIGSGCGNGRQPSRATTSLLSTGRLPRLRSSD